MMLNRTLLLFETNNSVGEEYLAISWLEKAAQKVRTIGSADKENSFLEVIKIYLATFKETYCPCKGYSQEK